MTRSSRSPTSLPGAAGTAGAVTLPEILAACGSGKSGGGGTTSKVVTVGSNASDAVPKQAYVDVFAKAKAATGLDIQVNTVDHNTFQQNINSYLQGTPQDVFFWFAGNRMNFFAQKGLATPISDVWEKIGPNFTDALKAASTGSDGKQYFVPFYYYPWAVFYRKSVFQQHDYQPAKTWDEYVALLKQQQKDGLTPLAMADDGAKKLLEYMAGTEAVETYLKSDPNNIAANTKADTSGYNALQKKAVDLIGSAQHISQFL